MFFLSGFHVEVIYTLSVPVQYSSVYDLPVPIHVLRTVV